MVSGMNASATTGMAEMRATETETETATETESEVEEDGGCSASGRWSGVCVLALIVFARRRR